MSHCGTNRSDPGVDGYKLDNIKNVNPDMADVPTNRPISNVWFFIYLYSFLA